MEEREWQRTRRMSTTPASTSSAQRRPVPRRGRSGRYLASTAGRTGSPSRSSGSWRAVVFYQVFTRYVLSDSAAWTEEIARYFLVAVVFIGASMRCAQEQPHPGRLSSIAFCRSAAGARAVDAGRRGAHACSSATRCGSPGCCCSASATSRWRSIDLPMGWVYGAVLFGFVADVPALARRSRGATGSAATACSSGPNSRRGRAMSSRRSSTGFLALMVSRPAGGDRDGGRLAALRDDLRQRARLRRDPPHGRRHRFVPAARGAVLHLWPAT